MQKASETSAVCVCVVRCLKNKELADSAHDSNGLDLQLLSSSPDLPPAPAGFTGLQPTRDGPSDGEDADGPPFAPSVRLFTGSQSDKVQSNVMKELPDVLVLVLGEAPPGVSMLQPALAIGV